MRFVEPKVGATRVRNGFLAFPMTLKRQTRWMETTSWIETYEGEWCGPGGYHSASWQPTDWVVA